MSEQTYPKCCPVCGAVYHGKVWDGPDRQATVVGVQYKCGSVYIFKYDRINVVGRKCHENVKKRAKTAESVLAILADPDAPLDHLVPPLTRSAGLKEVIPLLYAIEEDNYEQVK